MIKRFCYWVMGKHLHQWSRWKTENTYITYTYEGSVVGSGWIKKQTRVCRPCGLVEYKEL